MAFNKDTIRSWGSKIRPDPVTGEVDLNAITRFIMNNLDDPDVMKTLEHANEQLGILDSKKKDLGKIDFNSIPLKRQTLWLVKLQFGGWRDAKGQPANAEDEGVRQSFHLHCWMKIGPGIAIGQDIFRMMEEFIGTPPTSKQVENFIRGSMATPYPEFDPCIPNGLLLSTNLGHHKAALRPFLDSLPSPFWWKVTSAEVEGLANQFKDDDIKAMFRQYMKVAKEKKDKGNKEFGGKRYPVAVECYEEAIDFLDKAKARLTQGADDEMIKEARGLQAICFANCSVARLSMGQPEDIENAIEDAESAIHFDKCYPKGYIRLSNAYKAQGKLADAEEAIAQALRLPELENNEALVDYLITLQTNGRGLPTDDEAFEKWHQKTFSEAMKGVNGLWLKLCNEHVAKMHSSATEK